MARLAGGPVTVPAYGVGAAGGAIAVALLVGVAEEPGRPMRGRLRYPAPD